MTVVAGEPPTDFDVPLTLDQYRTYAKLPPEEQIQYVARIVEGTTELQRALFEKYAAEHPHLGLIVAERK
jgi:hypothetical protein